MIVIRKPTSLLVVVICMIGMNACTITNAPHSFARDVLTYDSVIVDRDGNSYAVKKMPDNNLWMTSNLKLNIPGSYCYNDSSAYCKAYGRLYTWEAAKKACPLLGEGWHIPTDSEWRALARHYGGVRQDSEDNGAAAYHAMLTGGEAGFNLSFGGSRDPDSSFARLNGHGLYWTATENGSEQAYFYNFGKGSEILNRHDDGEKNRAFSVRCKKIWAARNEADSSISSSSKKL